MSPSIAPFRLDLSHDYPVPAPRAFSAWARPEALLRWARPHPDWRMEILAFVFAVGGEQVTAFGPTGEPGFVNSMRYHDIVPGRRIVMAGDLSAESSRVLVSTLSVMFRPRRDGCRIEVIEQGVFLDGQDHPDPRRAGWLGLLERLALELREAPANGEALS